jgi:HD domain
VELKYFAHSDPDGRLCDDPMARWQLLSVHLRDVARLAEEFARGAGASGTLLRRARALGLLHDVGKYTLDFQKLLRGEIKKATDKHYTDLQIFLLFKLNGEQEANSEDRESVPVPSNARLPIGVAFSPRKSEVWVDQEKRGHYVRTYVVLR